MALYMCSSDNLSQRFSKFSISCSHPRFYGNICRLCNEESNNNYEIAQIYRSSVPFRYIDNDLRLSVKEISRLKTRNTEKALSQRKLHLVLDLDHTLIHSIAFRDMKRDEFYYWEGIYVPSEGKPFVNSEIGMVTKLRPFVQDFLEEVSTMFDICIYTIGSRRYAKYITQLLDPKGVYFTHIVAGEDCLKSGEKSLDVILAKENATLVLDDTEHVWTEHMENLINIEKYFYFDLGASHVQMIKGGKSESDDVALVSVLELLKKAHKRFFEEYDQVKNLEVDVRSVLKKVREV